MRYMLTKSGFIALFMYFTKIRFKFNQMPRSCQLNLLRQKDKHSYDDFGIGYSIQNISDILTTSNDYE